ncbi:MAG: ATP-dependent DNA helicase RecG [Candidatus Omnitrophica bacterium]|nr:ATP-dependent DNA helicase RecG [Candidatus Omnitrophota bacterium]
MGRDSVPVKDRQSITGEPQNQDKKNPLNQPLQYVKGVGPKRLMELDRLGIRSVRDLIFHFPRRYEDRSASRGAQADGVEKGLFEGKVRRVRLIRTRRGPTILRLELDAGPVPVTALWFRSEYLQEAFKGVQRLALFGRFERKSDEIQLIHPDYEVLAEGVDARRVHTGRVVPFYAAGGDLTPRVLRSIEYQLLTDALPHLEDPLPQEMRRAHALENRRFALKSIHFPSSQEDLTRAYRRFVFDEFFFIQLLLAAKRRKRALTPAARIKADAATAKNFVRLLPFEPTAAQNEAIAAVSGDLNGAKRMHRLLQGDVGSGKTTVAAFALFAAAQAGRQGAMLAPTEILAQQHYMTLSRLFLEAGIRVGLVSRGVSAAERQKTLEELASGELAVVVGTHALLQDPIRFKNLDVLVVDEQHKFGVYQREKLEKKSASPHVLMMTATPIPQTLAISLYGDMDVTEMKGRPAGRGRVSTCWTGQSRRSEVLGWIEREIAEGRQAYVVYPALDSAVAGLQSVQAGVEMLQKGLRKEIRVGWIHGQMKADEKKLVMTAFANNEIHVLAATTVIEVGVDVPNANFMVIENADRFGLSQLHQLRGRIGRGKHASYCVLVSDAEDPVSRERLEAFCEIESGFEIAEKDLKLRGPGDIWGTRQHGIPQLKIGDLARDGHIMSIARAEADKWIAEDPLFKKPEHASAKEELLARFPGALK